MAFPAKSAKGKSALSLGLAAALLACPLFFTPANASYHTKAIAFLTRAQATTDETAQSKLLSAALKDMKLSTAYKEEQKQRAIDLVQAAITDLGIHDSSQVSVDITDAIAAIRQDIPPSGESTGDEPPPAAPPQ